MEGSLIFHYKNWFVIFFFLKVLCQRWSLTITGGVKQIMKNQKHKYCRTNMHGIKIQNQVGKHMENLARNMLIEDKSINSQQMKIRRVRIFMC